MNSDEATEVFTYSISYDDLIENWIHTNEKLGHVLIIYEPRKHEQYLKNINLPYTEKNFYLAEVLCIELFSFDSSYDSLRGRFADKARNPYNLKITCLYLKERFKATEGTTKDRLKHMNDTFIKDKSCLNIRIGISSRRYIH